MRKIIMFTGHIGCGKTESSSIIANILIKKGFSVLKTHFAWKLKNLLEKYYLITKQGFLTEKPMDLDEFKQRHFELFKELTEKYPESLFHSLLLLFPAEIAYNWYVQNNSRRLMQWLGTTVGRDHIDKNYWIQSLIERIEKIINEIDYIVIDDLRFVNEFENLKERFKDKLLTIHIHSDLKRNAMRSKVPYPKYLKQIEHEKEIEDISLLESVVTVENNMDTLKELYSFWLKQIDKII